MRRSLLRAFPEGARLLELGGGTGEDALALARQGRRVHLTDGSPEMVAHAEQKVRTAELTGFVACERLSLEELEAFAAARQTAHQPLFDGCFSNFASLNCVEDLGGVARGLSALLHETARAQLVVFGPCSPGEVATLLLKGRFRSAFRRFSRRPAAARVAGHTFTVSYPAPAAYARSFAPWFRLEHIRGIGVLVPPSSAEPFISRLPGLLALLEAGDRVLSAPLALLGDHVLLDFVRTDAPAAAGRS
ncbi:MAG: class I SAM-dependent methyltransferase [Thermoanaerobaculia bacterium]